MEGLRERPSVRFLGSLQRGSGKLALAWWLLLALRAALPTGFAVATGILVGDVSAHRSTGGSLAAVGGIFFALQVLGPIHAAVSANLGDAIGSRILTDISAACLEPAGIGHLEDPSLAQDKVAASDFDLGLTGPPMSINMDFITGSMATLLSGVVACLSLVRIVWWAPLLVGGVWASTNVLLRESGVWKDRNTDEVRLAAREADYAFRLAVDPPAAKELRVFGLADWTVDRFATRRTRLYELRYAATRLSERSLALSVVVIVGGNLLIFRWLAEAHLSLQTAVIAATLAVSSNSIAFGGLSWAMDGAAAPVVAVGKLGPAMAELGAVTSGSGDADGKPAVGIELRDLAFSYPRSGRPVFDGLNLTIPAGTSLAIVGQNGAGKTTLAKLLCQLYDPTGGSIVVDGRDLREFDPASWRRRVTAVFQDFVRLELSLRDNVDPSGTAEDATVLAALAAAGAGGLAELDTPLSKSYAGGTDLSGGQWQRIAIARALCAVGEGAGLILLDEPTAQLDVRGEAEIFERVLAATADVTAILVSHRFSTVRHADLICVLERGRVVELGSHEELMALDGRYRTMFDLQAQRFAADAADAADTPEEAAHAEV